MIREQKRSKEYGMVFAFWSAIVLGAITLDLGDITTISANRLITIPQYVLLFILLPGIFAAAISGFAIVGAFLNWLVYFCLIWPACHVVARIRDRKTEAT